jgi:hypothetical protein
MDNNQLIEYYHEVTYLTIVYTQVNKRSTGD